MQRGRQMTRVGVDWDGNLLRSMVSLAVLWTLIAGPRAARAACTGDCNGNGEVTVDEILIMVNIALGNAAPSACAAGGAGGDITVVDIVAAVNNALNGCPATPTPTPSILPTGTPTPTTSPGIAPTFGVLGARHFLINPARSPFKVVVGGLPIVLGNFQGQTNGVVEPAFMDFEAGQPDPVTGFAAINIVAASEYIFVSNSQFGVTLCIKPLVPVTNAGAIGCNGGVAAGFSTSINHNLGTVGLDGFTEDQCAAMNGRVEGPNQTCAAGNGNPCRRNADCDTTAGAGDGVCGLSPATCTAGKSGSACQADADCDTTPAAEDGVCGRTQLHPGACNGPLTAGGIPGDTGPGEVIIAPSPNTQLILNGLPIELSMEAAAPCGDEGPGDRITFALTSGMSKSTILNANNSPGQTLEVDAQGQNFSCTDWHNAGGPGRLVLGAPAIDIPTVGDVVTTFTFDGAASPPTPTRAPTRTPTPH